MSSTGILGTSLTWDELERELRSALGTEAKFGFAKSVQDIGDGLVSCCGLVTCDWLGAVAEEKLPPTVVLKIPSVEPLRKRNAFLPAEHKISDEKMAAWAIQITEMHNTEVATYEFLSDFEGCPMPKMYYGNAFKDGEIGHICIENISHSRTMNFYERHTVAQLTQIARGLGKIQACSLKKEPTRTEFQQDFFTTLSTFFSLEAFRGAFKGILSLDSSDETTALIDHVDVLLPEYHAAKLGANFLDQIEFRKVLVNGDMHTGNVMIDECTGDVSALLDWQCTHLGLGVEDLHRIAITSLTAEERRTAMPMLVVEMYKSMVENLDGVEPPYSLDKLLVLSDLMFMPVALFLMTRAVWMLTGNLKDPELSDGENTARKEVMLNKVIGCLEDILEFDVKNKSHAEKLKITIM